MIRHLFIVCYDIRCSRRRRKALKLVKGNAIGGQKSVHECWLSHPELQRAIADFRSLIEPTEDRVTFLRLDPRATVHALGVGVAPEDGDFFYLG